jgi:prolipoprotein diacylglyceryltransferase
LWLHKRRRFNGQVIYAYLMVYSVARFTIEFWRDDQRGWVLGISTSQFISIALFLLGLALMIYNWRRGAGVESGEAGRAKSEMEGAPEAGSAALAPGAVGGRESELTTNP